MPLDTLIQAALALDLAHVLVQADPIDCSVPLIDHWTGQDGWTGTFAPYACRGPQLGLPGVAAILVVGMVHSLWTWGQGNVAFPMTWLTLFAGVIFTHLPGPIANVGLGLLILAVAAGLFSIWQWWSDP